MSTHIHIPLEENCFYHIYNHGNGDDNIFYQTRNYAYFLTKYDAYLSDFVETYAYCLLPNHFHLLIKVKAKKDFIARDFPNLEDLESLTAGKIISELFRRFFLSYSKSINKQQNRTGSLFQKNFKRKQVNSEVYFTTLIYYIHHQLAHHGFKGVDDKNYQWNSYGRFLMDRPSKLPKEEVLEWFGGKKEFVKFHQNNQDLSVIKDLIIEDDE